MRIDTLTRVRFFSFALSFLSLLFPSFPFTFTASIRILLELNKADYLCLLSRKLAGFFVSSRDLS